MGAGRRHATIGERVEQSCAPAAGRLLGGAGSQQENPVAGTALKLTPYTVLPGEDYTASWGGTGGTLGSNFTDQGLQFTAGTGVGAATIASPGYGVAAQGMRFSSPKESSVKITFPTTVVLTGLVGVAFVGGEGNPFMAPQVSSGGQPLQATDVSLGSNGLYTFSYSATVSEIDIDVTFKGVYLMALTWAMPDIDMPILPQAPGLYALKIVTQVSAGQPDSHGNVSYQPVTDGDPVIEFAYLQTTSGPGTATVQSPPVDNNGFTIPAPDRQSLWPALAAAANTPASAFPNGGRLNDLSTYTQWSWPGNGDAAAYYGYDVNVEFTETYVNALYATFLTSDAPYDYAGHLTTPAVHLRCVDRNQRHTVLLPVDIRVPSAPQQSANVSGVVALPPPPTIAGQISRTTPANLGLVAVASDTPAAKVSAVSATAVAAAQQQLERRSAITVDAIAKPALDAAIGRRAARRARRSGLGDLDQPRDHRYPAGRACRARRCGEGPQPVVRAPGAADPLHRRRRRRPPIAWRSERWGTPLARRRRRATSHLQRRRRDRRAGGAPGLPGPRGCAHFVAAGAVHHVAVLDLFGSGGQRRRASRRHRGHTNSPVSGTHRD